MDMTVGDDADLSARRIEELIRWHGTDESDLPPPHTLQNLSRDTVAALHELQHCRQRLQRLRSALGRAFWAESPRELHAIVLAALGPPDPSVTEPGLEAAAARGDP